MYKILEELSLIGLVPSIQVADGFSPCDLAQALQEGGLSCAQISFHLPAAEQVVQAITQKSPNFLVGVGDILTPEQADKAVKAGAKFIASTGFNPEVVQFCTKRNIPILPGCATASEVEHALRLGVTHVLFFPAQTAGGLPLLKALAAQYPPVRFLAAGDVGEAHFVDYLTCKKVFACEAPWITEPELLQTHRWNEVTHRAQQAVRQMLGFELRHVGINTPDEAHSNATASAFEKLFGFPKEDRGGAYFAGEYVEVMKKKFYGEHGHIAISTNNAARAAYHLEKAGAQFNWDSAGYNPDGALRVVYLKEEIGGFAVHILQK